MTGPLPDWIDEPPRCVFCGQRLAAYVKVAEASLHNVDCAMCGRYRISADREMRFVRRQFSRRTRVEELRRIRAANSRGYRYSVDDGRDLFERL
jgi:hypothetical protein